MLPSQNRLRKKTELERILRKGKGFKEEFLILKTIKNNLNKTRFGFIVSRKVSKKANVRNKIKRRLRALIKGKLKKVKLGTDNLIVAAPGLETKDFWEIEETVNKLFKKAKIIKTGA
jgi:ribonuclease P protein component